VKASAHPSASLNLGIWGFSRSSTLQFTRTFDARKTRGDVASERCPGITDCGSMSHWDHYGVYHSERVSLYHFEMGAAQ
jgi:hypothetical protein